MAALATGSRQSDQNVPALDLDLINGLSDLRAQRGSTVPEIKPPAVPGAGDRRSLDRTFRERSSLVGADPVDCRDDPAHVEQRHDPTLDLDFLRGALRQLFQS